MKKLSKIIAASALFLNSFIPLSAEESKPKKYLNDLLGDISSFPKTYLKQVPKELKELKGLHDILKDNILPKIKEYKIIE